MSPLFSRFKCLVARSRGFFIVGQHMLLRAGEEVRMQHRRTSESAGIAILPFRGLHDAWRARVYSPFLEVNASSSSWPPTSKQTSGTLWWT